GANANAPYWQGWHQSLRQQLCSDCLRLGVHARDNYIHVTCFSSTGKGCLKPFLFRLLWIKGIQATSNILAAGNFLQHLLQIGRFEIEVNRAAYSAESDSACAGMSHESRDRIRQRKFIRGQLRWITISKSRCRIILWIKAISSNIMQ